VPSHTARNIIQRPLKIRAKTTLGRISSSARHDGLMRTAAAAAPVD